MFKIDRAFASELQELNADYNAWESQQLLPMKVEKKPQTTTLNRVLVGGSILAGCAIIGISISLLLTTSREAFANKFGTTELKDQENIGSVYDVDLFATKAFEGKSVILSVRNSSFPVRLYWGSQIPIVIPSGESSVKVASGRDVSLLVAASLPRSWSQPYRVFDYRFKNESFPDGPPVRVGEHFVSVDPDGDYTLLIDQPSPPWNAAEFSLDGESLLLTMEAPRPEQGWNLIAPGAAPSTSMNWQILGTEEMARATAQRFIDKRDDLTAAHCRSWCRETELSLIVPVSKDGLSENLKKVSTDELARAMLPALEKLKNSRSWDGTNMKQFLEEAAIFLGIENQLD